MTDSKPISTFDEICHLTIETMRKMDMQTLWQLKKQAAKELDRAKLTKGCIDLALSLKQEDEDRAAQAEDDNQPSLLD
ncbi:MAG: hypothetical protein DI551_06085 [Micavibrio aeruginosavorus]|jgi:hypothetical protein|uniref:Uncharacterized protein n=1 Tax=Micavibrio aeruginosavorus TaxID=349221 RepID=A0A2W5N011_9BACT|nr:MAG: hypothetical protein DI582_10685 [Azospirillum brasilense]PZQ45968.1 MAG: hypothetical protein DI551_06085 [Micavibrio aeruginosavorus]